MPDQRSHRGAHPEDHSLFAPAVCERLNDAVTDLNWLLGRGYAAPSAVELIGNRYQLRERQRTAVLRAACPVQARLSRGPRRLDFDTLDVPELLIDGYNVLVTVEAALGGGVLLQASDETFRDMASVHGTYRKVMETIPALQLLGEELRGRARLCVWYLDQPVSNSGRLKSWMESLAVVQGWNWRVELVKDPDALLRNASTPVATADSAILDTCQAWVNLARDVIERRVPEAWVIRLTGTEPPCD